MQADAETSPSKQQRARSQSLPPAPRRQSVEDLERLSGKSLDDGFYSDEEDETTTAIQAPSDETTVMFLLYVQPAILSSPARVTPSLRSNFNVDEWAASYGMAYPCASSEFAVAGSL